MNTTKIKLQKGRGTCSYVHVLVGGFMSTFNQEILARTNLENQDFKLPHSQVTCTCMLYVRLTHNKKNNNNNATQ